jgi:hypothetical protein
LRPSGETGTPRSVRTGVIVGLSVVAFLVGVALLTAHGNPSPTQKPAAKGAAAAPANPRLNSCNVCLERNPLLPAARFTGWDNVDVRKSYEAAAKYPATMDLLHCFCECQESTREQHKTLLTCFTTQHAAGCGICQHEALMAAKLKDEGRSDEEVEYTVESLHKTDGHRPTKGRGL